MSETKDNTKSITLGFHTTQMSERGTEVALFDYAYYNKTILGNRSIIFYRLNSHSPNVPSVVEKFKKEFIVYCYSQQSEVEDITLKEKIDGMYIITVEVNGNPKTPVFRNCPNYIHSVFRASHMNLSIKDVYSVISDYLNTKYNKNFPVVPHMINMPTNITDNLRSKLNIPKDALVFGRHGGFEQFSIRTAHEAIKQILQKRKDIYFVFCNTRKFYEHPNIKYLNSIVDITEKIRFINTCDAMIHARYDGETFGLSIGEFCSMNKPVITVYSPYDNAHIDILKDKCIIYKDVNSLLDIFDNFNTYKSKHTNWNAYECFTPENVIYRFEKVYLWNTLLQKHKTELDTIKNTNFLFVVDSLDKQIVDFAVYMSSNNSCSLLFMNGINDEEFKLYYSTKEIEYINEHIDVFEYTVYNGKRVDKNDLSLYDTYRKIPIEEYKDCIKENTILCYPDFRIQDLVDVVINNRKNKRCVQM